MALRIALAGVRHSHILALAKHLSLLPDAALVAVAEDEPGAAGDLLKDLPFSPISTEKLWEKAADFDAVAIGDVYGRRGALATAALSLGKHVISDKPLCTRLEELTEIEKLAGEKTLAVGAMFDLRDLAPFITLKRLVAAGTIGKVLTVGFSAQHPLMYGKRPPWYFEPGAHGGTLNDIAVHGTDLIPWLVGSPVAECLGARVWNRTLPEVPHFETGGQCLLSLADGTGVMGDVSYHAPAAPGYSMPHYWRFTLHGEKGVLETGVNFKSVLSWQDTRETAEEIPLDAPRPGGYLADFLNVVSGKPSNHGLHNSGVFAASRVALKLQAATRGGVFPLAL